MPSSALWLIVHARNNLAIQPSIPASADEPFWPAHGPWNPWPSRAGPGSSSSSRPFVTLTLTTPSGRWKGGDYELRWAGTETQRCRQFLPQPEDTTTATPRADCDPSLALSVQSVASATVGRSMVVHAPTCAPVTCSVLRDGALVLEQALTITGYGNCDCQADPIAMTVPADP